MQSFDVYPLQSRLRLVHPFIKMGLFTVYTILALASQCVIVSIVLLVFVTMANAYMARVALLRLFRLMMVPASFVLLGSLSVIIDINPNNSLIQIPVFGVDLGISPTSLHHGILLTARSFSAFAVLYALILNTTMTDILFVCRKFKLPETVLEIMVFVYRNIFVFSDVSNDIFISQKSRLGYRSYGSSLRSNALLCGRLFVIANNRAERLYHSMVSRCFDGKLQTLPTKWQPNYAFLSVALIAASGFAFALYVPLFCLR